MHSPLSLVLLIIAAAAVQAQAPADACPTRCVRKEVRALTSEQRSKYFNAMRAIMKSGKYDEFTDHHLTYTNSAHGNPAFFTWHRAMLREFEKSLQAVDKDVCMHYWSWDVDSQRPDASPIFTADYYQTDANGGCVNSEWLGGWRPQHPNNHCLRRAFDASGSLSAFVGPELLNSIVARSTDYDSFRVRIEGSPHANVHVNIGSDMSTMASPNDPLFYAHHTFIDKLWANWQKIRGDITLYSGRHWSGRRSVSPSDSLEPFPYTVANVFDTNALCYTYEEFQGSAQRAAAQGLPVAKIQGVQDNEPISLDKINSVFPNVVFVPFDDTNAKATAKAAGASESASPSSTTVAADDKYNLVYLRTPKPLPADWIKMNNLTEEVVRQHEQEYSTIVTQLNGVKGYVSPCALLHRPDLLANDIKAKKAEQYVCPIANKGNLEFKVQGQGAQEASNILATVKKAAPEVQGDLEQLRGQIVALVGEPVVSKSSASNFLTSLDEKEKNTPASEPAKANAHALQASVLAMAASLVAAVMSA